ncbi:DUF2239 family protein [Frateuria aurantia]
MSEAASANYTTFVGHQRVATGSLRTNALAARKWLSDLQARPVLIVDDRSGRVVDIDLRGSEHDIAERFAEPASSQSPESSASKPETRGRGRPRLGVVPREVTLLPRHWDWLAGQPGGASVALRRLVEEARRGSVERDQRRQAHERAYHFMLAVAGDLAGFEEATRALFADDAARFEAELADWPVDVRRHATGLAWGRAEPEVVSRDKSSSGL